MDHVSPQTKVLQIIDQWTRTQRTPMPNKELYKALVLANMCESTARKSVAALVKKGMIRRAVTTSNQTHYVMVGSISR